MIPLFKNIARPILKAAGLDPYHLAHRVEAMRVLRNIQEERGTISKDVKKSCDEYSQDVLGSKVFSPWLYVYAVVSGSFKEGWIPDNFYGKVVVPRVKGGYGEVSSFKPLNRILFRSDHFPDLLSFVNGNFYHSEAGIVSTSEVRDKLFSESEKIVFKLDRSMQGKGIHFFTPSTFDIRKIITLGNGVFQSFIDQDEGLSEFSPSEVSTLRITTAIDENFLPSVKASYLRLGDGGGSHVQSSTHIRVSVDLNSGGLDRCGYTPKWTTIEEHPKSGKSFAGFNYPMFREACSVVLGLHSKIPFVQCVGWDVCVDRRGDVRIIEWNGAHNDIKFSEATQGPCFRAQKWHELLQAKTF